MTPPDSDWGLFKSMTPEQVADAKAAETDSDEREVWMAKKECPRCHGVGLVTMPSIPIAQISLPLSLAQRILAALEQEAHAGDVSAARLETLASELRAVIGK